MPRAEHELIIKLAQKWQQKTMWLLACHHAEQTVEAPGDDPGWSHYAQSFSELQNELANLDNLIRYNVPELLHLSPFVSLLHDHKSVDIDQRIRDLRKIESSVRQIESATGREHSAKEQTIVAESASETKAEGTKDAAKPKRLRGNAKQRRDDAIREFAKENDHTQAQLALIYKLSESTINEILNSK